ncbi:hypothetical protein K3495_g5186 [Podosphaera aphanis]|nr:hypothetical protein K3495_g5186 [Podosphaera aphanis]
MRKTMLELRNYKASQLVDQAINTSNGPRLSHLETIPIDGNVRVWREDTVNINGDNVNFRSTVVAKYFDNDEDRTPTQ